MPRSVVTSWMRSRGIIVRRRRITPDCWIARRSVISTNRPDQDRNDAPAGAPQISSTSRNPGGASTRAPRSGGTACSARPASSAAPSTGPVQRKDRSRTIQCGRARQRSRSPGSNSVMIRTNLAQGPAVQEEPQ